MLFEQANNELDLIIRHIEVLTEVVKSGPVGILRLAEATDMQPHKVRYSLRILEQNGLIEPSRQGAIPGSRVLEFIKTADFEYETLTEMIEKIKVAEQKMAKLYDEVYDSSE